MALGHSLAIAERNAIISAKSTTPLPRSGRIVSHPTFGHEASVESGAWAEDDYDDEDEFEDYLEYDVASDDEYDFGE